MTDHPATIAELREALKREKVLLDSRDPHDLALLRREVVRIAAGMDDDSRPPPMLWSGIPEPTGETPRDSDWCFSLSVGGTNTIFFLMRLDDGEIVGLDAEGREVRGN